MDTEQTNMQLISCGLSYLNNQMSSEYTVLSINTARETLKTQHSAKEFVVSTIVLWFLYSDSPITPPVELWYARL